MIFPLDALIFQLGANPNKKDVVVVKLFTAPRAHALRRLHACAHRHPPHCAC